MGSKLVERFQRPPEIFQYQKIVLYKRHTRLRMGHSKRSIERSQQARLEETQASQPDNIDFIRSDVLCNLGETQISEYGFYENGTEFYICN